MAPCITDRKYMLQNLKEGGGGGYMHLIFMKNKCVIFLGHNIYSTGKIILDSYFKQIAYRRIAYHSFQSV